MDVNAQVLTPSISPFLLSDEKTRETQEKLVDVNVERKDETEVPEVDDHFRGNDVNEEKDIVMKDLKEEPNETPKTKFTTALLASQMEDVPISGNAFVSGSNMNGGCVMTGRPSSRVLAPPGGHTSFKLG